MDILRYVDLTAVVALALVGLAMVAAALGGVVLAPRGGEIPRPVLVGCLVVAIAVVLVLTVPGGAVTANGAGVNLVPGRTLLAQVRAVDASFVLANLTGNVGVFVPVGFFAGLVFPGRSWRVAGGVLLLAVAVETGQLAGGRTSDVDDVLLNALGGLLGALLAAAVVRIGASRVRPPAAGRGTATPSARADRTR